MKLSPAVSSELHTTSSFGPGKFICHGREIIPPVENADRRPARAETREKLIASIAQGRRWLTDITSGSISMEDLAGRECCSIRRVTMMLSLAFLAPALVRAAVEAQLPRGIGVSRLFDAPIEWTKQHEMLGLALGGSCIEYAA